MKYFFVAVILIFSVILTFAQDSTSDKTIIKSIIQKQEEAWNRHDFATFCEFYSDNATFVNYIGMFWQTRKEISDHLHNITDCCLLFTTVKLDFKSLRFLNNDIAIAYCEETIVANKAYDIPDHHYKPGETEYKMIIQVFIRKNDDWKITAQQLTAIDQYYSPHNAGK